MHLLNRLKRIERCMIDRPCQVCDGRGKMVRIEKQEGEPDPPIDPSETCPGCGKYWGFYLLWVDEDALGNRRVPA